MISIDRDSPTPLFEQLTQQLRYLIATGHFQGRKNLPSTRNLAATLGISFHTVRKAYQILEKEGIVESEIGSGYRVRDPAPLGTSERIERGAAVVEEMLHRLAGLGLAPGDIEYLVDEQLSRIPFGAELPKVLFVSSSGEVADQCAADIARFLQRPIDAVPLSQLSRHKDADYVIAEFKHLGPIRRLLSKADVFGATTELTTPALHRLSNLLPSDAVGLLTAEGATLRYLTERIKFETQFPGQILAASASSQQEVVAFAESVDLLVYSPAVARRVRRSMASVPAVEIAVHLTENSRRQIMETIPTT
ncbi:MAG: GntR family transcriptional regulator [Rhodothermia bacterium]|nr:GntR family transcriptional regulator [Rhodothermia bacterium]